MRLIRARIRAFAAGEAGYTLIAVLGATFLVSLLVTAALAATNDDQRLISDGLGLHQSCPVLLR